MKRFIIISVIAIFILTLCFLVLGITRKTKEKALLEEQISRLPSFSFITLERTLFNSGSIKEGPILIVRFHPECEHCQYEISELLKSKIFETGAKILLISDAEQDMVISFLDQFNITEKQDIIPLLDTAYVFSEVFGSDIVPSNYIYNRNMELVKVLKGEYKVESILKYLETGE
jgi:hypothetical protein